MAERRRYQRYACSWPVRLWLTDERFLFGRTVDVSRHGMRLVRSTLTPTDRLKLGTAYRLDVTLNPQAELHCVGVIRHQQADAIGVETRKELPVRRLSGAA